jgi:hypothetical protein
LRNEVAESLALQESWESVPLHGLEDIVFRCVEEFWVTALVGALNGLLHLVQDALGNDNLSLGAG